MPSESLPPVPARSATSRTMPPSEIAGKAVLAAGRIRSLCKPVLIGIEQSRLYRRLREHPQHKLPRLGDRKMAIFLAQRVVIKAFEHMPLFHRRSETLEESVLRRLVHHPVLARNQHLRRRLDCTGVVDDAAWRCCTARAALFTEIGRRIRGSVPYDATRSGIVRQRAPSYIGIHMQIFRKISGQL
jgi:hypothetical protein